MDGASAPEPLAQQAFSGIAWRGLSGILIRLLRFVAFVVLARLVAPEAFGTLALALVFVTVLQHFASGGLSSAIIQHPKISRSHLDAAFYLSCFAGLMLSVCMLLASTTIARVVGQPDLAPVLAGLSVMPALVGISMVPEGWLSREMDFRLLSIRHVVAALGSIAVGISLAFAGFGVWALVAQTIGEAVISCVILWGATFRGYRPGLSATLGAAKEMASYGSKVAAFDLTTVASTRSDDLLIGAFLGPAALGVYSVAYRLLTVIQETMHGVANAVAFPIYARLQSERERLAEGYLRASSLNLALAGPIFIFLALAAPQIVDLLFGQQWVDAGPVMAILAVAGLALTVTEMNNALLQSTNYAGIVFGLSAAGTVFNILGFVIAVQHGILWVAGALAIRAYLFVPIVGYVVARRLDAGRAMLSSLLRILPSLLATAGLGYICRELSQWLESSLLALVVSVLLGAPVYLVVLKLTNPRTFDDLAQLVRRISGRCGYVAGLR